MDNPQPVALMQAISKTNSSWSVLGAANEQIGGLVEQNPSRACHAIGGKRA
jgi:hypothetical protein